ncbi:hypothetical protein, partial [Pseudomonas syringae group genomosp. 7]|uniref:hypothetical protein n=1 Tax=Pseudomonas syringae group genomosp. 7 TaxID=251699 RepID=UPI00376F8E8B
GGVFFCGFVGGGVWVVVCGFVWWCWGFWGCGVAGVGVCLGCCVGVVVLVFGVVVWGWGEEGFCEVELGLVVVVEGLGGLGMWGLFVVCFVGCWVSLWFGGVWCGCWGVGGVLWGVV